MGELIARVLNDYIDHVAKDCKYEKCIIISWDREQHDYTVYFTQPNAGTEVRFGSSAEESLVKTCLIAVAIMKTYKESRRRKLAENRKEKTTPIPN